MFCRSGEGDPVKVLRLTSGPIARRVAIFAEMEAIETGSRICSNETASNSSKFQNQRADSAKKKDMSNLYAQPGKMRSISH
jgi:hypothetical protein